MEVEQIGDVIEVTRRGTLWELAEITDITGDSLVVCNTEDNLHSRYSIPRSNCRKWTGSTFPKETRETGIMPQVSNFHRMNNVLQSAAKSASDATLVQHGATLDHLLNVGFRSAKQEVGLLLVTYYRNVVEATLASLRTNNTELKALKLVLHLLLKALDKGGKLTLGSGYPVLERFCELQGPELCFGLLTLLHHRSKTRAQYLNALHLLPLFRIHRLLPLPVKENFINSVLAFCETRNTENYAETKHLVRFIEEVDYCFNAYGLSDFFAERQRYALKRRQVSLCVGMLSSDPSRFDAIEQFSALLKAHSRNTKFQQILNEFRLTEAKMREAVQRVPEYIREYFLKVCCMGNFSIQSILAVINTSDDAMQRFISAELFEDFLRYKSTEILMAIPQSLVRYCIDHFGGEDEVQNRMFLNGVDERVLLRFFPSFQLNCSRLIELANSSYTNLEKMRMLRGHYSTYEQLVVALQVKEMTFEKEKGALLSLYFNTLILQAMWIRERTFWRRVPISLFGQMFSEFY